MSENTTGEECTNCEGKDSLSIENASEAKIIIGDTDGLEIQSVLEEENPDSGKREGQISPNRLEQEPYSEVEKDSCSIPQNSSQITEQMAVDADGKLHSRHYRSRKQIFLNTSSKCIRVDLNLCLNLRIFVLIPPLNNFNTVIACYNSFQAC